MSKRGFTILEVTVSAALMAVLIGAVAVSIHGDVGTHRALTAPINPLMRGQRVLERLGAELRMASEWGEDRDHDGEFDAGEDTNGNSNLDADWNLADGAVDQPSLSFNRRIDLRDEFGNVVSTGLHSRRIIYRLENTDMVREWQVTLPGNVVQTRKAVVAKGIKRLRFSRTGPIVTVAIDIKFPNDGVYTVSMRTRLRN